MVGTQTEACCRGARCWVEVKAEVEVEVKMKVEGLDPNDGGSVHEAVDGRAGGRVKGLYFRVSCTREVDMFPEE